MFFSFPIKLILVPCAVFMAMLFAVGSGTEGDNQEEPE